MYTFSIEDIFCCTLLRLLLYCLAYEVVILPFIYGNTQRFILLETSSLSSLVLALLDMAGYLFVPHGWVDSQLSARSNRSGTF
jgi:hypothetical protein